MGQGVITLTTDFGLDDVFVGVMKGVIAGIHPSATVIDLTHAIPPFDVLRAAVTVRDAYRYFPEGAVHVVVVDPGVGGDRAVLGMESGGHLFLAPDNGVLSGVAALRTPEMIVEVTNRDLFLPEISGTFHGRDIFAPVAARLASGLPLSELGPPATDTRAIELPSARVEADGSLRGEVLWSDRFGNLVTSLRVEEVRARFGRKPVIACVGDAHAPGIAQSFSDVAKGELAAVAGSFGALEIAVREGDASRRLGAGRGAEVIVRPSGDLPPSPD